MRPPAGWCECRRKRPKCVVQADGPRLWFRYRHWKLGDDIDLIVRCEHDGVMTGANGEVSFINMKTLNEWDSRVRSHDLFVCVWKDKAISPGWCH